MKERHSKYEKIAEVPMFDPAANAEGSTNSMFHGNTTGLIDMIDQQITPDFYQKHTEKMFANMWHPTKYPVTSDTKIYHTLTEVEKESFKKALSHLTSLDSLQVHNLPRIAAKIRYPEIAGVLAFQEMQESLHSFSYAYIYNSLFTKEEAREIRDMIKTDPVMRERAIKLKDAYTALDGDTVEGMLKILLTNIVLEAVMFYSIFNFFFYLKYRGKMINVATVIAWIKKDEVTHIDVFADILNKFKQDYPDVWDEEFIVNFLIEQTKTESKYSSYIIDRRIPGFSPENIEMYTKHRMNKVFRLLDIGTKFENVQNPFLHLERVGNVSDGEEVNASSTETSIFEAHSINYFDPAIKIKDYKEFLNAE